MEILCDANSPAGRILIIHSWWGLTRSFRAYARRLCEHGYAVGLSDLYDGRIATDQAQATALRRRPRRVPMYRTLTADIRDLLASHGGGDSVALIGFSMGGHWAVWLAQRPDLPVRSVVLYYAARAGDFSQSRASFLAHFADDDPWVSRSARRNMERALSRAGRDYAAHDYPETRHWFAESACTAEYDDQAAGLAFRRTVAHIDRTRPTEAR